MAKTILAAVLLVSTIVLFARAAPSEEKRQSRMIRLSGGCSGDLEFFSPNFVPGAWVQALDRDFGVNEGRVVCRQLGCPTGTVTRTNTEGNLDRFQSFGFTCTGNETNLDQCTARNAVVSGTQDGIAVMCSGAASLSIYMLSLTFAVLAAYLII